MAGIPGLSRPLVVLGATGSIGRQALEVAAGHQVAGLAARRASEELAALGDRYPSARIAVGRPDREGMDSFRERFGGRVSFGADAIEELAALPGVVVVNAVVGSAGLSASVAALRAGNRLALANKESLVAGGPVMRKALEEGGGELIPVDSEHSGLFQCLVGEELDAVERMVLTASGGPFREYAREDLETVTVEEALDHPTWKMGPRITVDSATLLNKGFEVIEAHFLFGLPYERIEVVIHPQSFVHALVSFIDGSAKAHLGEPDMRVPIRYALSHPRRTDGALPFSLAGRTLQFEEPDLDRFPALGLAYRAGRMGGSAPAVLNAADEVAVEHFLEGRLGFMGIPALLEKVLEGSRIEPVETVEQVLEADREARHRALELVGAC